MYTISIHAPRTGSDLFPRQRPHLCRTISIHAPRTGSDLIDHVAIGASVVFQSTLPARGATSSDMSFILLSFNFNPRSPHGERRVVCRECAVLRGFQSTLPARGATERVVVLLPNGEVFQSTLPARGATLLDSVGGHKYSISIHAPRTGSDSQSRRRVKGVKDFNPRSPHGERRRINPYVDTMQPISIHAPRTGSDVFYAQNRGKSAYFNPRSPHGERLPSLRANF